MEERSSNPIDSQKPQQPQDKPVVLGSDLSPGLRRLLENEGVQAEVDAALDAALEEGILITRKEAKDILHDKKDEQQPPKK